MQDFSLCYLKNIIVSFFFPVPHLDIILRNLSGSLYLISENMCIFQDVCILDKSAQQEVQQALYELDRRPVKDFRSDQYVISKYLIDTPEKLSEQDLFLVSEKIYPTDKYQDLIIIADVWQYLQSQGDIFRVGTTKEFELYNGNVQNFLSEKLGDFEII